MILRSMAVLIDQPWMSVIPAVIFLVLHVRARRRIVLAAAIAWLLYLPYEYAMKLRVLCSGECNIRVDLLLLYPVLLVLSIVAFVVALRRPRRA